MSKSSITPTVGRKVWLWTPGTYGVQDPKQAFDATIICVGPDGSVNLAWTNHWGTSSSLSQVELRDPSYQVGQAKQQFADAKKEESGS
jgi:hypothetical protein